MAAPATLEEYLARYQKNTVVDGFFADVAMHTPCPFCAAPDFVVLYPAAGIMPGDDRSTVQEQMEEVSTCSECGRSGRSIVDRNAAGVQFEFVQTGGDDPPPYLDPAPRRV